MFWKVSCTGTQLQIKHLFLGGLGSARPPGPPGASWLLLPVSTAELPQLCAWVVPHPSCSWVTALSLPRCGVVWEGREAQNTGYVRYCKINLFEDTRSYKRSEAI